MIVKFTTLSESCVSQACEDCRIEEYDDENEMNIKYNDT